MKPSICAWRALALAALMMLGIRSAHAEDSAWVQIFNGKDISDWVPKFEHQVLGVNQNNTFQVNNGMLDVVLNQPYAKTGFGHLFYNKRAFSYYLLRIQFRFLRDSSAFNTGASGDPGAWTIQNNGAMLHSQTPASMTKDQSFPNSIEDQLIGPLGTVNKPPRNANVCVPGTKISYPLTNGTDYYDGNGHHCTNAKLHDLTYNKTLNNGTWIYTMAKVMSDSLMVFYERSRPDTAWDSVMGFAKIRTASDDKPLTGGYIAIQAEGTSTEFKTLEVLDLVGCMDKSKAAYRSYYVKNDAAACAATPIAAPAQVSARPSFSFVRNGDRLSILGGNILSAELLDMDGKVVGIAGAGATEITGTFSGKPGLYLVRVRTASGITSNKVPIF